MGGSIIVSCRVFGIGELDMKVFAYLAAGLMAATTIAPGVAQAQYGYRHHDGRWHGRRHDRGWHHGRYWHRGRWWRGRRVVCRRYWHHHYLVRRCHTVWY